MDAVSGNKLRKDLQDFGAGVKSQKTAHAGRGQEPVWEISDSMKSRLTVCTLLAKRRSQLQHPESHIVKHSAILSAWLVIAALGARPVQTSADTPLVNHGDSWRYHKGNTAAQADWKTTTDAGLDAAWLSGNGGFGYADNSPEVALVQTPLSDMQNNYTTVFMRRTFQVSSEVDPAIRYGSKRFGRVDRTPASTSASRWPWPPPSAWNPGRRCSGSC
jgi:hypothetical protein